MVITTNTHIEIFRQSDEGEFFRVASGIDAFIEPAGDTIQTIFDEVPGGQIFIIFTDFMEIEIADKIIDDSQNEYIIQGVKKFQSFLGEHTELTVRKWSEM